MIPHQIYTNKGVMILMAINSLFDDKRKQKVRDALDNGDLGPIFRKKSSPEGVQREGNELAEPPKTEGRVPGMDKFLRIILPDQFRFRVGNYQYNANELLLLGIEFDDSNAVREAILGGADINHKFELRPLNPLNQDAHPSRTEYPGGRTPLHLAYECNRHELAQYLVALGAKE